MSNDIGKGKQEFSLTFRKAWSESKNILEGFTNLAESKLGIADPEVEEFARDRMVICGLCPSREGNRCGECGCILSAKTRSPDSECPLGKW